MSSLIGDNLAVSMHYELIDDKGELIDSAKGAKPLAYPHGDGNIIPGLEQALTGKTVGDDLQVRLEPSDGYCGAIPELIQTVDRGIFLGVENVEVT